MSRINSVLEMIWVLWGASLWFGTEPHRLKEKNFYFFHAVVLGFPFTEESQTQTKEIVFMVLIAHFGGEK